MITTTRGFEDVDVVVRCDECLTIAFRLQDGKLIIEHRHHGQRHTTKKPLDILLSLCNNKPQEPRT